MVLVARDDPSTLPRPLVTSGPRSPSSASSGVQLWATVSGDSVPAPLLVSWKRRGPPLVAATLAAAAASSDGGYSVRGSVLLPASFASADGAPAGGIRVRVRAPSEHAGKLSSVTVGGQTWAAFNAAEETIDIASSKLTADLLRDGLPHIVATFA